MHSVRTRVQRAALVTLLVGSWCGAALAQEAPAPDAEALVQEMARTLAGARGFAVEMDTAWDVVQPDGSTVEIGEVRRAALQRPGRLRVDAIARDGGARGVVYDGDEFRVFDEVEGVWTSVDVEEDGSVDAAIDYFTEELGMRLPLSELFSTQLPETLSSTARSVSYIGEETLDGEAYHHVLARGDALDVQLWIATDDEPLPGRVVITYKAEPGQPQFRADLSDWTLNPRLPADLFTFEPAADIERIPVLPRNGRSR